MPVADVLVIKLVNIEIKWLVDLVNSLGTFSKASFSSSSKHAARILSDMCLKILKLAIMLLKIMILSSEQGVNESRLSKFQKVRSCTIEHVFLQQAENNDNTKLMKWSQEATLNNGNKGPLKMYQRHRVNYANKC